MAVILQELLSLLALERLEINLFRGSSHDIGTPRVYGGQVLGQALRAAQHTVEDRVVHSLHAYFLREGDPHAPIIYDVDRSRDGRSFSARRVVAIQHGAQIFTLSASFQTPEPGLEFHTPMPEVPDPESLPSIRELETHHLEQLPEKFKRLVQFSAPFELKSVEFAPGAESEDSLPCRHFWIRTVDTMPDDPHMHEALLAYISDYGLLTTALRPHHIHFTDTSLKIASIDHAMWFHRPFRLDQWLLYSFEAISTSSARGLARGSLYNRDGVLVASTVQEGLLRIRDRG